MPLIQCLQAERYGQASVVVWQGSKFSLFGSPFPAASILSDGSRAICTRSRRPQVPCAQRFGSKGRRLGVWLDGRNRLGEDRKLRPFRFVGRALLD